MLKKKLQINLNTRDITPKWATLAPYLLETWFKFEALAFSFFPKSFPALTLWNLCYPTKFQNHVWTAIPRTVAWNILSLSNVTISNINSCSTCHICITLVIQYPIFIYQGQAFITLQLYLSWSDSTVMTEIRVQAANTKPSLSSRPKSPFHFRLYWASQALKAQVSHSPELANPINWLREGFPSKQLFDKDWASSLWLQILLHLCWI